MKVTNKRNCCYFETTNINNNKSLEKKVMPDYLEGKHESDPVEFINLYVNNSISCDAPNSDINAFTGSLSTVGKPIKLSYGRPSSNRRKFRAFGVLHAGGDGGLLGGDLHGKQHQNHVRE